MAGPNICAFYMPQKKRGCRQIALPMKLYCGNHDPGSTTDHVPCPYDPSHSVPKEKLERHLTKCPKYMQLMKYQAQPYYRLDVNAGSDDDEADMGSAASNPFAKGTAARRLAYALSLGESVFEALLVKVESSHAKVCSSSTPLSVRIPEKLEEKLAEGARMQPTQPPAADSTGDAQMQPTQLPASDSTGTCNGTAQEGPAVQQVQAACNGIAQEGPAVQQVQAACNGIAQEGPVVQPATKHLRQQASIIGNMQSVGLLPLPPSGMVVEMGAGKGGLGALMVSHAGVQRLVLNDIRGASFRNKADKWLREIELHRVKADLKDFYLPGTPGTMTPGSTQKSDPAGTGTPGIMSTQKSDPAGTAGAGAVVADADIGVANAPAAPAAAAATKTVDGGAADADPTAAYADTDAPNAATAAATKTGDGDGAAATAAASAAAPADADADAAKTGDGDGASAAATASASAAAPADADAAAAKTGDGAPAAAPAATAVAAAPAHAAAAATKTGDGAAAPAAAAAAAAAKTSDGGGADDTDGAASGGGAHPSSASPLVIVGKHLCGAATDFALRSVLVMNSRPGAEEGAERSADDDKEVERVKASVLGLAIAPCCHHRCGWRAYVGKALFRELGFTPKEFHLVSYMTGWALCGHNAPAGCGADTTAGEGEAEFSDEDVEHEEEVDCGRKHKKMKHKEDSSAPASGSAPAPAPAPAPCATDLARNISRSRRMAIGRMCKELIDKGRMSWLASQCKEVHDVLYIEPTVTGECRLFLAKLK